MKSLQAYIAADGTLHRTRKTAAVADIAHLIRSNLPHKAAPDPAIIDMVAEAIVAAAEQVSVTLDLATTVWEHKVPRYHPPENKPPVKWESAATKIFEGDKMDISFVMPGCQDFIWTAEHDRRLRSHGPDPKPFGSAFAKLPWPSGPDGEEWLRQRLAFLTEHDADMPAPVETVDV